MAAILKTVKRNISTTVWPILMKFAMMMYICPADPSGHLKSKMAYGSLKTIADYFA